MYSLECIYRVQCTFNIVQCKVYSVRLLVHSLYCTSHCTVLNLQCTVYIIIVQCTVCSLLCTLYIDSISSVQGTLYVVQWQCTLYIIEYMGLTVWCKRLAGWAQWLGGGRRSVLTEYTVGRHISQELHFLWWRFQKQMTIKNAYILPFREPGRSLCHRWN